MDDYKKYQLEIKFKKDTLKRRQQEWAEYLRGQMVAKKRKDIDAYQSNRQAEEIMVARDKANVLLDT